MGAFEYVAMDQAGKQNKGLLKKKRAGRALFHCGAVSPPANSH
jgi:hypothetical protein